MMDGVNRQLLDRKRRLHLIVLLGLVVFSSLLYYKTTSYYFASDTFDFLGPLSKANLTKALLTPELTYTYRPVPRFCWLVLFTVFGRSPFWYHVLNILTHALCGFLVYLLARRLKEDTLWAVIAGALFVSMPVHFDVVSTVYHWVEPISTGLLLTSLLLYVKTTGGERPRLPWLSAGVYFVALLTKQSTASMLLILLLWEFFFNREGRRLWGYVKNRAKYWLPLVGAIALAAALNFIAKPGDEGAREILMISLSHRLPFFLVSMLVKAAKPWFLPGLVVMVAAPLFKGGRLARFSLLATVLLPFPFYSLAADRHAYLPAVGLALALAAFIRFGAESVCASPDQAKAEKSEANRADRLRATAPMVVDLLLICAIIGFFLMPYRAPDPALFDGNGTVIWHSQVDPVYWRSMGRLIERLTTSGSPGFGELSGKGAFLMLASLVNLVAIAGLLILRVTRWRGPLNQAAWKVVRAGALLVFIVVFSATTYSTAGKDWRLDGWKTDLAMIEMKKNYPDLPDKTVVYVSDDDAMRLFSRLRFYYDLKDVIPKVYSEFFSDVALGEDPPDAERMRCFVFKDGKLVRMESDEMALRENLRTRWRPEYADSEVTLGRWTAPRGPDSGEIDNRWEARRFSSGGFGVQEPWGRELDGKVALCYSDLSVTTLAVNEAELIFGVEAQDRGLHKVWLLWQLDGDRWFSHDFDFAYDGVVRRLDFKLSRSRDWFLADRLSGLCFVFEGAPDTIRIGAVNLTLGLRVGAGLMRLPGGEEQLDLAFEEVFKVE